MQHRALARAVLPEQHGPRAADAGRAGQVEVEVTHRAEVVQHDALDPAGRVEVGVVPVLPVRGVTGEVVAAGLPRRGAGRQRGPGGRIGRRQLAPQDGEGRPDVGVGLGAQPRHERRTGGDQGIPVEPEHVDAGPAPGGEGLDRAVGVEAQVLGRVVEHRVEQQRLLLGELVGPGRAGAAHREAGALEPHAVGAGRQQVGPDPGQPAVGVAVDAAPRADRSPGGPVVGEHGRVGPVLGQFTLAVGAGAARHLQQGGEHDGVLRQLWRLRGSVQSQRFSPVACLRRVSTVDTHSPRGRGGTIGYLPGRAQLAMQAGPSRALSSP